VDRYDSSAMCSRKRSGFHLATCSLAATRALPDRACIINNGHIVPAEEIKARPEILHRHLGV
jgi:hypothetical protein